MGAGAWPVGVDAGIATHLVVIAGAARDWKPLGDHQRCRAMEIAIMREAQLETRNQHRSVERTAGQGYVSPDADIERICALTGIGMSTVIALGGRGIEKLRDGAHVCDFHGLLGEKERNMRKKTPRGSCKPESDEGRRERCCAPVSAININETLARGVLVPVWH